MTGPFATVDGLTLRHIGRRAAALRDLDLRWEEGERLLLLGPSGSGKSTLALALNGVIPHALDAHWEAGRVVVAGADTREIGLAATTAAVGVVFQDPEAQLVMLELDDEIAFGLEGRGMSRDEMRRRVREARLRMGLLGPRVPDRLAALSGGMKQRVAVASILALGQRGIVLDEPTANLDPEGVRLVVEAIADIARDRSRSLLLIEHRLDAIGPLIDRVAVLAADGHLALEGAPDDVFDRRIGELDALGVWVPELARLGKMVGAAQRPHEVAAAARAIVEHWPSAAAPDARATPRREILLAAHDVAYRYREASVPAVDRASVHIAAGELVAIVGRNGAGKTTLGQLLAGAIAPTSGRVEMRGSDLRGGARCDARVAYVFQYPAHQFVTSTVRDEIAFSLRATGADAGTRRRADDELARWGLDGLALANPHSLSHGQQRRLSVATALVTDPDAVVLDEPTFGQDRRQSEALLDALGSLHAAGRTVVLITHDLAVVADRAERVIAMADGRIAFDGPPTGLFARPDLLAACGLDLPPVAEAFALARRERADVPLIVGLRAARQALAVAGETAA